MSSTFYPQSALEGFGNALANRLGVNIDYTTGQPRTDGSTVYLPSITKPLTDMEFRALCGIAVHEAAHVYFKSCPKMAQYATDDLKASCFNAVLDVADETRIETVLASADDLLRISNILSEQKIATDLKGGATPDPVWLVLATAILVNRIHRRTVYDELPSPLVQYATSAFWILRKGAKTRRTRAGKPAGQRTKAAWTRLFETADKLVDLLRPLHTPKGKGGGGASTGMGEGGFGPAGSDASEAREGASSPQAGDTEAGNTEGEQLAQGACAGSSGGSSGSGSSWTGSGMDTGLHAAMKQSLVGPMERMARADHADGLEDGYLSGPRLGRNIEQAMIDGRCFARHNAEGEDLHIAVLLDVSDSMRYSITKVAAVAQAFVDATANVAKTRALACFDNMVTPTERFDDVTKWRMGGTYTGDALKWARETLEGLGGRRVIVCITDGCTARTDSCIAETQLALSEGIAIIGIAYQYPGDRIRDTMPGAEIAEAQNPTMLACALDQVARKIAR